MPSQSTKLWLRAKKLDHTETDSRAKHFMLAIHSHGRPHTRSRFRRPVDSPDKRGLTDEKLLS